MLLKVNLVEHESWWRFPGSLEFSRWLGSTPWMKVGGLCILQIPGKDNGLQFANDIVGQVHGHDAGVSQVRCEILEDQNQKDGLRVKLAKFIGIPLTGSDWQISLALARWFAERPTVLVVTPPGSSYAGDLWQEAMAIKDEMSKTNFCAAPTFILLGNNEQRIIGRKVFDFTKGQPVFGVLEIPDREAVILWNAYAHVRLAWESGGNPALAYEIRTVIHEYMTVARDEQLEKGLNQWATQTYTSLSKEQVSLLDTHLANRDPTQTRERSTTLELAGLLWRPWGSRSLVPTPWVARALLCRTPNHDRCWLLRSSIVCVPLAHEILSRCQDLEQQIRAESWRTKPPADVPDFHHLWSRFQRGEDETTIYPKSHPSPPHRNEDVWMFASLGQFLQDPGSPMGRSPLSSEITLSRLRNTLAHGHYVCWEHVEMIREIQNVLSLR